MLEPINKSPNPKYVKPLYNVENCISFDVISAVRIYCYNNKQEFYNRHVDKQEMKYSTFVKAMTHNEVYKSTCTYLMELFEQLGIIESSEQDGTLIPVYRKICMDFIEAFREYSKNESHPNFNRVKHLCNKYGPLVMDNEGVAHDPE